MKADEKQALDKLAEVLWVFFVSFVIFVGGFVAIGYFIQWLIPR
jgi:hypothetical protein